MSSVHVSHQATTAVALVEQRIGCRRPSAIPSRAFSSCYSWCSHYSKFNISYHRNRIAVEEEYQCLLEQKLIPSASLSGSSPYGRPVACHIPVSTPARLSDYSTMPEKLLLQRGTRPRIAKSSSIAWRHAAVPWQVRQHTQRRSSANIHQKQQKDEKANCGRTSAPVELCDMYCMPLRCPYNL